MRKPLSAALLTLSAAALALGMSAASASAATAVTWSVSPGGAISGAAGTTTLTDTTSGLAISCKTSTLTGKLKKGTGLKGDSLGTITNVAFNNCSVDGLTLSISSGAVKWPLNALTYKSPTTTGTITKIHVTVSSSECSLVIDGTSGTADNGKVKITYSNKTHKLSILPTGGNLHVWDVSGCLGAVSNGDAGTIKSAYAVTPTQTITGS
ncbi:MAG: hypothetical protein ACRDNF_24510 [Streptosporangiaceae bacterium]